MKVLYLTYENVFLTGILQAQVVRLLDQLGQRGVQSVLFSVNKKGDIDAEIYSTNKSHFNQLSITLYEFDKTIGERQSISRFFLDLVPIVLAAYKEAKSVDVIHARSYGAAVIALIVSFLRRKPFIFDMRGVLPEEIVRVGKVKKHSLKYKLIKVVERILVNRSSYVFTVSEPFSRYVEACFGKKEIFNISNPTVLKNTPPPKLIGAGVVNFIYSGSAQPWHLVLETLSVFKAIHSRGAFDCHLSICTADIERFQQIIKKVGLVDGTWSIGTKSHESMQSVLSEMHVGFCFREASFETQVSCPVKFAEYVANNVFVVTNEGVGDLQQYVGDKFAGVVFSNTEMTNINAIADEISNLINGREVSNDLSMTQFDWSYQADRVFSIYKQLERGSF